MKKTEIVTKSADDTSKLGKKIAQKIQAGGVDKRVNSPTFIIMRTYEIRIKNPSASSGQGHESRSKNFYHLDLYRVESEKDSEGLGIREILSDPENIVVIEWPEKIASILPEQRIEVYFSYLSENERKIEIHEN